MLFLQENSPLKYFCSLYTNLMWVLYQSHLCSRSWSEWAWKVKVKELTHCNDKNTMENHKTEISLGNEHEEVFNHMILQPFIYSYIWVWIDFEIIFIILLLNVSADIFEEKERFFSSHLQAINKFLNKFMLWRLKIVSMFIR